MSFFFESTNKHDWSRDPEFLKHNNTITHTMRNEDLIPLLCSHYPEIDILDLYTIVVDLGIQRLLT